MRSLSLCLLLAFLLVGINSATAGVQGLDRRQEEINPPATEEPTKPASDQEPTRTEAGASTSTTSTTEPTITTTGTATGESTTQTVGPHTTTAASDSPSSTSEPGTDSEKDPDKLPLEPKLSPAFVVSGVVLLIAGVVYTLIGIKKRWAQVFLSTAFLAALSVAVLIVYVMNTPVPDGRQGGYFAACFFTGIVFGAVSLVFQEITEGMGCLLGGFCLSMWLLALKPGGLLSETEGKVAFIAAFTAATYATSFSHYTRPYGLIGSTSFAGATATILGIDCFSRAGLKEFWLYIWGLNPDVFPLNTSTYPITRGIRVELAGIVVTCFIGIISQVKLWKVIRERRKARMSAKADEEEQRDREEEEVGRNLEEANSREMAVWEATYEPDSDKHRADSGIGREDSTSGKDFIDRSSTISRTEDVAVETRDEDGAEKKSVSSPGERSSIWGFPGRKRSVSRHQDLGEGLPSEDTACEAHGVHGNSTPNRISNTSTAASVDFNTVPQSPGGSRPFSGAGQTQGPPRDQLSGDMSPTPSVTPLPFKAPFSSPRDRDEDELSVAASAGSDIDVNEFSRRFSRLSNFTRLSGLFGGTTSAEAGDSPRNNRSRPTSGALAVNIPEPSDDGLAPEENGYELKTTTNSVGDHYDVPADPQDFTTAVSQGLAKCESQAADDGTHRPSINIQIGDESGSKRLSASPLPSPMLMVPGTEPAKNRESVSSDGNIHDKQAISASGLERSGTTASRTGSLTADAVGLLPSQASSVTMSYRTNEWAKHLSRADIPATEPIQQPALQGQADDTSLREEPVIPVNVVQLQQTALDAHPPPMVEHHPAATSTSDDSNPARPALTVSGIGSEEAPNMDLPIQSPGTKKHLRPSSQYMQSKGYTTPNSLNSILDGPTAHNPHRNSSTPFLANSVHGSVIRESGEWDSSANRDGSTSPAPPLMAMRDSMIKNRMSSPFLNRNSSAPSLAKYQQAYTDASAGSPTVLRGQNFAAPPPDDDMPLAQRRELIRQQSLNNKGEPSAFSYANSINSYDYSRSGSRSPLSPSSRQPPDSGILREANLAAWRESVREEIALEHAPESTVEIRRADMLMEKRQSVRGKQQESMMAQYRDHALTEAMQRGDMQHLHREAMRKMQAQANNRT
ncbi:hypothetical protein FQN54_007682 [Arachnomyces sp. PD_36]|nr:hypothetical protein FQN54_007682 [Arachnomyces sp. PD_36]